MTKPFKTRITTLAEHVKREFPDGCSHIRCGDCPLDDAEPGTLESMVCELVGGINARNEWDEMMRR